MPMNAEQRRRFSPSHRGSSLVLCFALWLSVTGAAWAQGIEPTPATLPQGDGAPQATWGYVFVDEMADLETRRAFQTQPTIITYTVQAGDTVSGIAARFELDIDTLRWSNPELERNPDVLRPGTELTIIPVRGIYYSVQAGDTLENLSERFGVEAGDIQNYPTNNLKEGQPLPAGQKIVIPNGTKQLKRPKPDLAPGSRFAWPIVGTITQRYSAGHRGIDIGAPYGSPVYAARAGVVVHSSWAATGYGYTLIIAHDEGYSTLYSHLKGTWVGEGQKVARGQLIGEVGSTGNSTGPHVHFEVRLNDVRQNPLDNLPAQ